MSFAQYMERYDRQECRHLLESTDSSKVRMLLTKASLSPADFLLLLSPAAGAVLEPMAQKARLLTIKHFGRNILLYTPLYLSNYCVNHCLYCQFHSGKKIVREQLSLVEVEAEGKSIAATGIRHLLLLTGESCAHATTAYLSDCLRILHPCFASLGLEIYTLSVEEYAQMIQAGAESLTLYQETYQQESYAQLHLSGPKRDYINRLHAAERACQAGMRRINIGALFGLAPWRQEAFWAGLHAYYLQKRYPATEIAISLPRVRSSHEGFTVPCPVNDKELVQILLAFRLFLPQAGITISTRERAELRDNLLPLGVTTMSVGSKTTVGGYFAGEKKGNQQFPVADERSIGEIKEIIRRQGYQPVMKDWPTSWNQGNAGERSGWACQGD
ncbi:MAG: 2-iminoacetate synthase [Syntrophomonadaceae bacterium]|nr:2-iminoacetate synthase [Bacillota bacterium]